MLVNDTQRYCIGLANPSLGKQAEIDSQEQNGGIIWPNNRNAIAIDYKIEGTPK